MCRHTKMSWGFLNFVPCIECDTWPSPCINVHGMPQILHCVRSIVGRMENQACRFLVLLDYSQAELHHSVESWVLLINIECYILMEVEHDTLLFRKMLMKQKESFDWLTDHDGRWHQPTTRQQRRSTNHQWIGSASFSKCSFKVSLPSANWWHCLAVCLGLVVWQNWSYSMDCKTF